jgi:hypothetical protein
VVAHAFNPSTQEAEAGWISEFEASLVYRVSSRKARATQRNPVWKNQKKKKKKKKNLRAIISRNFVTVEKPMFPNGIQPRTRVQAYSPRRYREESYLQSAM